MLEIHGAFRVNKVYALSPNIQYAVLFLKDRMVFVRIGGELAAANLVGAGHVNLSNLAQMSVDQILGVHKKNFQILYGEITRVELGRSLIGLNAGRAGTITVHHGKKDKFDLALGQDFQACLDIVRSAMPDKLPGKELVAASSTAASDTARSVLTQKAAIPTAETGRNLTARDRIEASMKRGAYWVFIIAGLSLFNAVLYAFGQKELLALGLGTTQLTAVFSKVTHPPASVVFLILTVVVIGLFAAFGIYSRQGKTRLFVLGTALYALDTAVFIWAGDWVGPLIHAVALYFLITGVVASFKLERLKGWPETSET